MRIGIFHGGRRGDGCAGLLFHNLLAGRELEFSDLIEADRRSSFPCFRDFLDERSILITWKSL